MPNNIVATYDEFIGGNLYKRYPLLSSTPGIIPDSFLADISIMIGDMDRADSAAYRNSMYISKVSVFPDYIYLDFSDNVTKLKIAESSDIPVGLTLQDSVDSRTIKINPTTNIPVQGVVVIGTCEHISKMPGIHTLEFEDGAIFPACIATVPKSIVGIQVGDTIYDGVVTLEAGEYIDIQCTGNVIKISYDASHSNNNTVYTEAELLAAIKKTYGAPVITISGISPDNNGNIDILPTDCLMIETDNANHSISMYNPCAPTCATYDFLDGTLERINDLNKNVSLLRSMITSTSDTLAQMGVRVASVLESRKGSVITTTSDITKG